MARKGSRVGEIGGYWLSQRPNSANYYATWYDHDGGRNRQTRRKSLGTDDLREAEVRLAEFVAQNARFRDQQPAEMPLATVLVRYWQGHASQIASHEQARIALALWTEHWGDALVSDLTIERQEAFIRWLKERGYKNAYVSRVLSVGRAALNRAVKRQEITHAPFVIDESDRSDQEEKLRLSQTEMIRLLRAAEARPHVLMFCMIGLNTLARPDAILELSPFQVDLDARLISLNPRGRRQTKKYRPTVPITDTLLPFVQARDVERFVNWYGRPVKSIKRAFAATVKDAGLSEDITPYCLRHTMATELRRRGVPLWEVQGFLGHRVGSRVTETYAKFGPDHLMAGVRAIDAYFADLGAKLGGESPWSKLQLRATCVPVIRDVSLQVFERMVGVTGIEPVTPTMST